MSDDVLPSVDDLCLPMCRGLIAVGCVLVLCCESLPVLLFAILGILQFFPPGCFATVVPHRYQLVHPSWSVPYPHYADPLVLYCVCTFVALALYRDSRLPLLVRLAAIAVIGYLTVDPEGFAHGVVKFVDGCLERLGNARRQQQQHQDL